ncbi:hypothetical protein TNCV_1100211 [Trichonephila clavipes]|nr:hypothetical protein TNCV_1100211 [Trichonephila clavipes]
MSESPPPSHQQPHSLTYGTSFGRAFRRTVTDDFRHIPFPARVLSAAKIVSLKGEAKRVVLRPVELKAGMQQISVDMPPTCYSRSKKIVEHRDPYKK